MNFQQLQQLVVELQLERDRLRTVLMNIALGRVGDQVIIDVKRYANAQLRTQPSKLKDGL